jgi:hypothetical protein
LAVHGTRHDDRRFQCGNNGRTPHELKDVRFLRRTRCDHRASAGASPLGSSARGDNEPVAEIVPNTQPLQTSKRNPLFSTVLAFSNSSSPLVLLSKKSSPRGRLTALFGGA